MDRIEILTLIDITNTRVIRPNQGSQLELDQQRNFITLMQCIEIKSIVNYDTPPRCENLDTRKLQFGTAYKGVHKIWKFQFQTDRSGVYSDENSGSLTLLLEDLHEVPIIKNLTETINIDKPIFDCKDSIRKNIIARLIQTIGD